MANFVCPNTVVKIKNKLYRTCLAWTLIIWST